MLWEVSNNAPFIQFTTVDRLTKQGLLLGEVFKFPRRHYDLNYCKSCRRKYEHKCEQVEIDFVKKVSLLFKIDI